MWFLHVLGGVCRRQIKVKLCIFKIFKLQANDSFLVNFSKL